MRGRFCNCLLILYKIGVKKITTKEHLEEYRIMTRSKVFPHFVLTAHDRLCDAYARVEWADSAGSRGRSLFYNVDMGCQPPWAPTDDIPKMSAEEFFELEGDYQA